MVYGKKEGSIEDLKQMNNKVLFIFTMLALTFSLRSAQKIAVLPDLEKPITMALDGRHLCVLEMNSAYLFTSTNFKLLKKFGRKGEGPAEWKLGFKIILYPDSIVINDLYKLLVFTRDGNLKYELRKRDIALTFIWPVGKQYAGLKANGGTKKDELSYSILLLNKNLETLKELAVLKPSESKSNSSVRKIDAYWDYSNFQVYEDLIFVGDTTKGFYFEVFDSNGKLLYKIDKSGEVKRVPVTEKMKNEFLEKNKNSDDIQIGKMFGVKSKYTFPDYLPAFKQLYIEGGKIYAETYVTKADKTEVIVMDLKGNILKRVFLDLNGNCVMVFDNAFYYLRDNIDNDNWELFREPVE